jgi:hypothetical protein
MAKFNVKQMCYRDDSTFQAGEVFPCKDEDVGKHCDSKALEPADKDTEEAILVMAPESVRAAQIALDRIEPLPEKASAEEKKKKLEERKKAMDELARRKKVQAGGHEAIKNKAIGDQFDE